MSVNGQQAASGPQILANVRRLEATVEQLAKLVEHQSQTIQELQLVVRSEQEHTRRALQYHFSGADLVPAEKAELAKERGGQG